MLILCNLIIQVSGSVILSSAWSLRHDNYFHLIINVEVLVFFFNSKSIFLSLKDHVIPWLLVVSYSSSGCEALLTDGACGAVIARCSRPDWWRLPWLSWSWFSVTLRGCTILSRTEGFNTGNKTLTHPLSLHRLGDIKKRGEWDKLKRQNIEVFLSAWNHHGELTKLLLGAGSSAQAQTGWCVILIQWDLQNLSPALFH